LLIGYALWVSRGEKLIGSISALGFAAAVALAGPVLYWGTAPLRTQRVRREAAEPAIEPET